MKGFTLIELLVVVIIIGILASIALPQYEIAVEKSRAGEALINAKAILNAAQRHVQEYPDDDISDCTQIADVQLQGGSWGASCDVSTATSHTACSANSNVFSTKNFCYTINNGLTVTRMDDTASLYSITYTMPTGDTSAVASMGAGCAGTDYEQVCKLFTAL